ncbi:MAG: MlaD family protein [Candidatus Dactylopiibacterium sp.]|nr:MlaD family protein [Candidatus Dactylopiibacterium sp.]
MENRAYALAVGLFTLLLGGAVVLTLWWFSGGSQDSTRYLIVSPRSVAGLNPQAAVRYRGVRVGKVASVELQDSREVFVQIRVDADIPITRATRARIGSGGLTGQGYVLLDDDGSDAAAPGIHEATGLPLIVMQAGEGGDSPQELMARLRRTADRVDRVLSDNNLAQLDALLQNLTRASASLERTLAQSAALSEELRGFSAPANAQRFAQTLDAAREASQQLTPAMQEFRAAVARVNAAAGRVDRLGANAQEVLSGDTVPRAKAVLEELETSSRQLTRVLDEFERAPQMLLGGKHAQAPGPGEVKP